VRAIVRKVSYANVAATLALFVALGGSAAAAGGLFTGAQIEDGTVHGADLAEHTIGARELMHGAVGGAYVRDHSLSGVDIRARSLTVRNLSRLARRQLKGARGRQGARGQTGLQGPTGAQGPTGPSGATYGTIQATAPDVADLGSAQTILDHSLPAAGVYLVSGRVTITNHSGGTVNIGCGVRVEGNLVPNAGGSVDDGASAVFQIPYVYTVEDPSGGVQLLCDSGGAPAGVSVSGIQLNLFKFS